MQAGSICMSMTCNYISHHPRSLVKLVKWETGAVVQAELISKSDLGTSENYSNFAMAVAAK